MSNTASDTAEAAPGRANRLYWESDDRVDEIAERVGMSRSALYNAVQPLPAGAECADCGGAAEFSNRTRRDAGEAACTKCGATVRVAAGAAQPEAKAAAAADAGPEREPGWKEALPEVSPGRAALIGGAAVLGAALGTAAVRKLRS